MTYWNSQDSQSSLYSNYELIHAVCHPVTECDESRGHSRSYQQLKCGEAGSGCSNYANRETKFPGRLNHNTTNIQPDDNCCFGKIKKWFSQTLQLPDSEMLQLHPAFLFLPTRMRWMNLFAWTAELRQALNNSMFVTDGASVVWTRVAKADWEPLPKQKKTNPIIHIVMGSVETATLQLCCLSCNNLAPGGTTMNFWTRVMCHCWYLVAQTLTISRLDLTVCLQTVLSHSSIMYGLVTEDVNLTSRLIKRTPDNACYKGRGSYLIGGTLAHLSGGGRDPAIVGRGCEPKSL